MSKANAAPKSGNSSPKKNKRRKVTFSIHASEAREVILMGDFNDWNPEAHPMEKIDDSQWQKALMLPPGTYAYKFLVDGNWEADPQNTQTCQNCFGRLNSILDLPAR